MAFDLLPTFDEFGSALGLGAEENQENLDFLFGSVRDATQSGAFAGASTVNQMLLDFLGVPTTQTNQFRSGSAALREGVEAFGATQRQRLGDAATTGGFLDSGGVLRGLSDIDRAELQAFSAGLRDLLLGLEERRLGVALPFLQGAAGESTAIQGINVGADVSRRGQNQQFAGDVLDFFGDFFGGFGG